VFIEQQRFWLELVNARRQWENARILEEYVPVRHRDFSDPPGWSRRKAFNYLVNNVDLIRANHRALETGRRLDYDMLNNILSEGELRIADWGDLQSLASRG
jgi:hypothetical protein